MNLNKLASTGILVLGVAALAFASGERYARIGLIGAADIPTMPRAKDMVMINTGSYTVPSGYRLVLTGYGSPFQSSAGAYFHSDGTCLFRVNNSTVPGVIELPPHLAFPSGALVGLKTTCGGNIDPLSTAWGYLELDH